MNKTEREIVEKLHKTAKRLEELYFGQKNELSKLYDYIELRKTQLQYVESKEEMEFIQSYILKTMRMGWHIQNDDI